MTDYISREAALEECDWYAKEFCECEYAIMPLKGALENLHATDVRPVVRARWRYKTMTVPGGKGQIYAKWCCTACKGKAKERTHFCPNCGAVMEES